MPSHNRVSVSFYLESFYNFLASTGVNRVWLSRDKNGEFVKTYISSWRLVLFILMRVSTYAKCIYLCAIMGGYVVEGLDFYTQICTGLWLMLVFVAAYSDYYFMSIYPCFEVLCSSWNLQSEIYERLLPKRREEFKQKLESGTRSRTTFHVTMSLIAMVGLAVQYWLNPKGVLFYDFLVTDEPLVVTIFFGFLEEVFMYGMWTQAVCVILIPVLSYYELMVVFQYLNMELQDLQQKQRKRSGESTKSTKSSQSEMNASLQVASKEITQSIAGITLHKQPQPVVITPKKIQVQENDTNLGYSIDQIFADYRKLEVMSERIRRIMDYVLLATIIVYFSLISFDVFVAIRLYREGAYEDVAFFAGDCITGMIYWWVSMASLSMFDGAYDEFLYNFETYFRTDYRDRNYHLKKYKSLKKICPWLGPVEIDKLTVCTCMYELVNYYILAAMW